MDKGFKWFIAVLAGAVALGVLADATQTPEEKAARAARIAEATAAHAAKARAKEERDALEDLVNANRDHLELAYIRHIKNDAIAIRCTDEEHEGRFFFQCGLNYGGTGLAKKGLWEAAASDGKLVFYALNGRALRALEKIGESERFQKGHDRPDVDVSKVRQLFER